EARDISVLFIRRKEKEVQELGCAKRAAACQWKTFCNIFHKFDNAFIFFDHEARLRIVSEYHGLPDIDLSAVGRFQPLQHIQESGFTGPVLSHHANAVAAFESIFKSFENDFI